MSDIVSQHWARIKIGHFRVEVPFIWSRYTGGPFETDILVIGGDFDSQNRDAVVCTYMSRK